MVVKVLDHATNTATDKEKDVSRNTTLKSIVGSAKEETRKFSSRSNNYIQAATTSANLSDRMGNVLSSLSKAVSLMTKLEGSVYMVLHKEADRDRIVKRATNKWNNCENDGNDFCTGCQLCFTNTYDSQIAQCETCQGCIKSQCSECDKCETCNTCQSCYGTCVSCNSCQICYDTCNNYDYCIDCDTCQTICNSCQSECYNCQGCNDCQGCDTCEACVAPCHLCNAHCQSNYKTCDASFTCPSFYSCTVTCFGTEYKCSGTSNDSTICNKCVGCQSSCHDKCQTTCDTCQGTCNTCQICHTGCEHCDFCYDKSNKCKSCNSCQSDNSCNNCDSCQSCFDCHECQSVCYTGCYVCDSGKYDKINEEDLCGLAVGGYFYA